MSPTLLAQIVTLLYRLDELESDIVSKVESDLDDPAFYVGMMFGVEITRDELAKIVAESLCEVTRQ